MAYFPPRHDQTLPEVVVDSSPQALTNVEAAQRGFYDGADGKIAITYDDAPKYATHAEVEGAGGEARPEKAFGDGPDGRICGLRRRVFWIVLALALVVLVAVVVGGAVGGVQAAKDRQADEPAAQESAAQSPGSSFPITSPTPTSSSSSIQGASSTRSTTSTSSATSTVTPTQPPIFLNNQTFDEQGFAFQAFAADDYLGEVTGLVRTAGFSDLPFAASSYVWLRGGTGCCLTFCADTRTDVGFWCDTRHQTNASSAFQRIYIWCTGSTDVEGQRCS